MIESDFDIAFAANLALREKQIQQNYRPIIAVHKWFARRPGSLFRCLLLSEFSDAPLSEAYYQAHDLSGKTVADPFMGGGTPILEANRMGCDVAGVDINPMACWIVQEEIQSIDLDAYRQQVARLRASLEKRIGNLYRTTCLHCGANADAKYFLWIKTASCDCGKAVDLFPGYLLSQDRRHPLNVLICAFCGSLNEVENLSEPGKCRECRKRLRVDGPAKRGKCQCDSCGETVTYPNGQPLNHRLFAIEYYCPVCKASHKGRFFKKPDSDDLARVQESEEIWGSMRSKFVPQVEIPQGDETNRLHRWGYHEYRELFNARQLVGLELSCRIIAKIADKRLRHALATNLSDLLRYQNMVCRYDSMALKSLDVFSVHGFPVGLIACESNLLGIANGGTNVGSGGWSNIADKYAKAKAYCSEPYEIRSNGRKRDVVPISGEWIGDELLDDFMGVHTSCERKVSLACKSSTELELTNRSLDAVLTDPPYFGNVQYAELMDFCYVWLRQLVDDPLFAKQSTRHLNELTGNTTFARTIEHFTDGLSDIFSKMAKALKAKAPLAFTFHHNNLTAYAPVAVAILDSKLNCTASIPCPAEMAASIHIHGTASSIIDTVFVCRSQDATPMSREIPDSDCLARIVTEDIDGLRSGGVKPTKGDIRCIVFGHLTRAVVQELRHGWKVNRPTMGRLKAVQDRFAEFCDSESVAMSTLTNGIGNEVSV